MTGAEPKKGLSWLTREAIGVVLLFTGAFLALTLINYSPDDPGFGSSGQGIPIKNLGGMVGAKVSDFLIQFIGLSAFFLPVLLVLASVLIFKSQKIHYLKLKLVGLVVMLLSIAVFIDLIWVQGIFWGVSIKAGGYIGHFLANALIGLFSRIGALVIVTMIFTLSTMLTTGGSFVSATRKLLALSAKLGGGISQIITIAKERKARIEEVAQLREKESASPPPIIAEKTSPSPSKGTGDFKIKEPKKRQEEFKFIELSGAGYQLPSLELLDDPPKRDFEVDREAIMMNARILKKKLADYGVEGEVVEVHPGPVITSYEFAPAPGVKVQKIVNLSDDLSLALSAINVRIVAPIPGKSVVGIEIPNKVREKVYLKEILGSEAFVNHPSKLALGIGKDIEGEPVVLDLKKMPHLLVAGATGSGKSVSLNAMITSILFKATPDEVRFLLVDMKRLELGVYEQIPHLLHSVITTPKEAAAALKWAVREMEERYRLMAELGVRNVESYNKLVQKEIEAEKKGKKPKPKLENEDSSSSEANTDEERPLRTLPFIVIIIDELADLMMVAAKEVEESIARLAQMARAAGIHLILATQRPSVDVLTGLIKANFPARISFQVAQKVDSRTILDANGAERLLGDGDMLFLGAGSYKLKRIHGAFISEQERHKVVEFLRQTGKPQYDPSIVVPDDEGMREALDEEYDERYEEAVRIVAQTRQASISMLQRRLRVGYNRAARMIERMEMEGIVGPSDGVKPREVLIDPIQVEK